MTGHTGRRADPDDDERTRRGLVRRLVQQVDQRRYGEDRTAAAECAQQQSDDQPAGECRPG